MTPIEHGIRHVLLPTDLSPASEAAFAVALKITLVTHGVLTIVHVSPEGRADWSVMPTVRQMLTRWKVLPDYATVEDYTDLGIRVQFHALEGTDVVKRVLDETEDHGPFELIVMASHYRDAVARWMQPSVSEPIARRAGLPCLIVPERAQRRIVNLQDGAVNLIRTLIPIGENPRDALAIEPAMRLGAALGVPRVHGTILHIGPKQSLPDLDFSARAAWAWDTEVRSGNNLAIEIMQVTEEMSADLVAMATHGHDSPLDAIVGSHTERVLHRTLCPLLVVPVRN